MSESQELSAAAAAGAAAAVTEVQDQQRTEEVVASVAFAADVAAEQAADAFQSATAASEVADVAIDHASAAEAVATATAATLEDVVARQDAQDAKFDDFAGEIRGFFSRVEEAIKPRDNDGVQQVEVTHNAPETDSNAAPPGTGQEQANARSGSGTSQTGNTTRRKRFGR